MSERGSGGRSQWDPGEEKAKDPTEGEEGGGS